jgi:3-deoxy-manno-octulosonate cytidylyltransferase (CMP-KDO synthetase)
MAIAIIIPARYASTRFPGKPLALLNNKPMLQHVYEKAVEAIDGNTDVKIMVATEDTRIQDFCRQNNIPCIITPDTCKTGSDRVIEAADKMGLMSDDTVINLQGDVPLLPVEILRDILNEFLNNPTTKIATPVKRLRWAELDHLRESKKTTPFSGTTAILNTQSRALWFSKNIIPAIRSEEKLRTQSDFSPVYQHIGLYGYQVSVLERFTNLSEGTYEALEGLEQLRFIENGMPIQCIEVNPDLKIHHGIDSPEDLASAHKFMDAA